MNDAEKFLKKADRFYNKATAPDETPLRNRAVLAWLAATHAANALITTQGQNPEKTQTAKALFETCQKIGPNAQTLPEQFDAIESLLFKRCFVDGDLKPEKEVQQRIRSVNEFIENAKKTWPQCRLSPTPNNPKIKMIKKVVKNREFEKNH